MTDTPYEEVYADETTPAYQVRRYSRESRRTLLASYFRRNPIAARISRLLSNFKTRKSALLIFGAAHLAISSTFV